MKLAHAAIIILTCQLSISAAEPPTQQNDLTLWYDTPAASWEKEALPIGNGHIGAMIFGGVQRERIQFNEESLWIGDEEDTGAYQAFGDIFVQFTDTEPLPPKPDPIAMTVSALLFPKGEDAKATVDGNVATKWCVENKGVFPLLWEVAILPVEQKVPLTRYTLTSASDVPERDPKAWRLLGSQDDKTWTVLDERQDIPIWSARGAAKSFEFKNETVYSYYKFEFLSNHGAPHFQLAEIALGDLKLPVSSGSDPKLALPLSVKDYRRELDIQRALHTVTYTKNGIHYRREAFASYPAKVIAYRFTADKPGSLSGSVSLTDMHKATISATNDTLTSVGSLAGYSFNRKTPYNKEPLNFEAQVRVLHDGGTLKADGDKILFSNANDIILLLSAGTDFLQDRAKHWKGEAPHRKVTARLDAASNRSWDDLMTEHLRDYQNLFNRVRLDLGTSHAASLPTDVRLENFKKSKERDPLLETLLFQFGRYLTIATSRKGGLPANLQGKWNISNTPPWRCDYHTDINLQMNYWPTDTANLSECFEPYSDWIQSIRAVRTEATKKEFNKRGWLMRGESGLFGGSTWDWIPGASAWLLQNSYDHYRFTNDKEYLRNRAYPAMKEVCEYWLDSLIAQPDGTLVTPIGLSPEQGPKEIGISFDQQQVWELFNNTIEASAILGVDGEFRKELVEKQAHLLPPKIGKWGQLQEWMVDRDNPNNDHRHLSHLIALYPGRQISIQKTPGLAEAARVSLNARGDVNKVWNGWSTANKINMWARLQDGDRAYKLATGLLSHSILPNLFDTCPPFQIDGNFGYTAGVCEMLIQSHLDEIHLLPALPKAWATGSVKGLRARGGFTVDIDWKDGIVTNFRIASPEPHEVKIRVNGETKTILPEKL